MASLMETWQSVVEDAASREHDATTCRCSWTMADDDADVKIVISQPGSQRAFQCSRQLSRFLSLVSDHLYEEPPNTFLDSKNDTELIDNSGHVANDIYPLAIQPRLLDVETLSPQSDPASFDCVVQRLVKPIIADRDHHLDTEDWEGTRPLTLEALPPSPSDKQSSVDVAMRPSESKFLDDLVDAMVSVHDGNEDNPGTMKSWQRIVQGRPQSIRRVCSDMMDAMFRLDASDQMHLCEKKPSILFENLATRVHAICSVLRRQKTICKHLLEDPYLYQVIDDPVQAEKRVQNNRRVNNQKRHIIETGKAITQNLEPRTPITAAKRRAAPTPIQTQTPPLKRPRHRHTSSDSSGSFEAMPTPPPSSHIIERHSFDVGSPCPKFRKSSRHVTKQRPTEATHMLPCQTLFFEPKA